MILLAGCSACALACQKVERRHGGAQDNEAITIFFGASRPQGATYAAQPLRVFLSALLSAVCLVPPSHVAPMGRIDCAFVSTAQYLSPVSRETLISSSLLSA